MISPAHAEKRVWTCYDAKGHKTLQDKPCPDSPQAKTADAPLKDDPPTPAEPRKASPFAPLIWAAMLGAAVITVLWLIFVRRRRARGDDLSE
jgi:hypothetical protein